MVWDVTDDHLKALGRLEVEFSFMEMQVASAIWTFLGQESGWLTSHMSFTRLCQSLVAIAKEKMKSSPARVKQLEDIIGRMICLEGDRNLLIRALWITLANDPNRISDEMARATRDLQSWQLEQLA